MSIVKIWAGRLFGTNVGNLSLELDGDDEALTGVLRFNDETFGIQVFTVRASYDGTTLTGRASTDWENADAATINFTGKAALSGAIEGTWVSTEQTGGNFIIHPQQVSSSQSDVGLNAEQMFSVRTEFNAVVLSRDEIEFVADEIQKEFRNPIIVATGFNAEKAQFLPAFKAEKFPNNSARYITIVGNQPDNSGVNKVIRLELGQSHNMILCQSSNEAWTIGISEKFKNIVRLYEPKTPVRLLNSLRINLTTLIVLISIVVIPAIPNILNRAAFVAALIFLISGIAHLAPKLVPHASLRLGERKKVGVARFLPAFTSWAFALAAGILATLLAEWLMKNPLKDMFPGG